jgi:hypothetical protein
MRQSSVSISFKLLPGRFSVESRKGWQAHGVQSFGCLGLKQFGGRPHEAGLHRRMNAKPEVLRPAARYAAYFSPAVNSEWWNFGCQWLGRCASTGQTFAQPFLEGVPVVLQRQLTAAPRRYGWHATLKAPFELTPSIDASILLHGLGAIAEVWKPLEIPSFRVEVLDDFLALIPGAPCAALDAVAGACVTGLHVFSAPLSPEDLRRHRARGLTAREDALLLRWRYPFVLDRFRFHMSLTGSLRGVAPEIVTALREAAQRAIDGLPPCYLDAISLFVEPEPRVDFTCVARIKLGPSLPP